MIVLGLLLSLAAPLRAQTAPAPAAPVDASNLEDVFKRFTSGKPMLPTLKEVQAEQLKRDLAPRKTDSAAETSPSSLGRFEQPPMEGVRRDTTERVDVAVSRPLPRVELGVGASEENVYAGKRKLSGGDAAYGFVRFDLSKTSLPRKLLHLPTAIHSKTVVQNDKTEVVQDEYTTRFLTHPTGN